MATWRDYFKGGLDKLREDNSIHQSWWLCIQLGPEAVCWVLPGKQYWGDRTICLHALLMGFLADHCEKKEVGWGGTSSLLNRGYILQVVSKPHWFQWERLDYMLNQDHRMALAFEEVSRPLHWIFSIQHPIHMTHSAILCRKMPRSGAYSLESA